MPDSAPKYRRQKAKRGPDRAFVELNGKRHYLGQYGTPESEQAYHRLIAEWLAHGKSLPSTQAGTTVGQIIEAYLRRVAQYYRRADGTTTSSLPRIELVTGTLRELYGDMPANEFGPASLRALRQVWVERGVARKTANDYASEVKRLFRWAASHEFVPAIVYQGLHTVEGLREGRCEARETGPVRPVEPHKIDAVRPHVSAQVEALIDLQLLTGARAGELVLVLMRLIALDMSGQVWTYTPATHKTAHRGYSRTIYLGPQAQKVVTRFMPDRSTHAYLFSPAEAEADRRERQHEQRRTPLHHGNRPGTNRRSEPKRTAADHYSTASYRRAIHCACDTAFPPPTPLAKADDESAKAYRARLTAAQRKELEHWRHDHR